MKKKKGIGIALVAGVLLAVSAVAFARSIDCDIVCPVCGSLNVNHYHPGNDPTVYHAFCRDCNYEWDGIITE